MAILNIMIGSTGLEGVAPRVIYIYTTNTLAEVTAVGFLNNAKAEGFTFSEADMALVTTKTTPGAADTQCAWLEVSISGQNVTLVPAGSPGSVVLPTTANYIAHFTDALGTLSSAAANIINAGNIQAGLSGTAGYLASFPATAARGSLRLVGANSAGDTVTQITNASQAAARTYTIPDAGQSSSFLMTNSGGTQTIATGSLALTLGNLTVAAGAIAATLGAVSAGTTVTAGTGVTATTGNIVASAGNLVAGSAAAAGTITAFAGTGAGEFLRFDSINNVAGDFGITVRNAASIGQNQVISIPDAGGATANFVLDSGASSIINTMEQFLGIQDILMATVGTWTVTRLAQGNYALVKSAAADTSIVSFDITPMIQIAASKGFRLDSFDMIYSIATDVLVAHTLTLDRITYSNNLAVSINSVAVTGALATATQAQPYLTNVVVDVPAFLVTADSKYVLELTVNANGTTAYNLYGMMLRFSRTIS